MLCVHFSKVSFLLEPNLNQRTTKLTIRLVRPAKTQISLRIRAVWSESLLSTCVFYSLRAIKRGIKETPWQTGWLYGLICLCRSHRFYGRFCRITKTCLNNFDPLKPYLYIVKLGFPGVYNIFLFLLKNIDFGYSLEPPRRGEADLMSTHNLCFWAEIWKISDFIWKLSDFGGKLFSILE